VEPNYWEPSPFRDNGPFESEQQALAQFGAQVVGIPLPAVGLISMTLREALMLAGVEPSDYEWQAIENSILHLGITPPQAAVLSAWLIRAHLAGRSTTDG
jgi:hypothetical protein